MPVPTREKWPLTMSAGTTRVQRNKAMDHNQTGYNERWQAADVIRGSERYPRPRPVPQRTALVSFRGPVAASTQSKHGAGRSAARCFANPRFPDQNRRKRLQRPAPRRSPDGQAMRRNDVVLPYGWKIVNKLTDSRNKDLPDPADVIPARQVLERWTVGKAATASHHSAWVAFRRPGPWGAFLSRARGVRGHSSELAAFRRFLPTTDAETNARRFYPRWFGALVLSTQSRGRQGRRSGRSR